MNKWYNENNVYKTHGIGKINIYSETDLWLYMVMKWLKFTMKVFYDYSDNEMVKITVKWFAMLNIYSRIVYNCTSGLKS